MSARTPMPNKEIELKIEHFYNHEDREFHVSSEVEMLSILRDIAQQGSPVALHYGDGQDFVRTTLLDADEEGMWLDVSQLSPAQEASLADGGLVFVSAHRLLKIQFAAFAAEKRVHDGKEALYLEMPDYLLRIQRRECFRTVIPAAAMVECVVPVKPKCSDDPMIMRKLPLVDISCGGLGLLGERHESALLPGKVFPDCRIELPEIGALKVVLEVRSNFSFVTPEGEERTYVGCRFLYLDNRTNFLLQRYIARLQGESMRVPAPSPDEEGTKGHE